jgi:hypothetical protein
MRRLRTQASPRDVGIPAIYAPRRSRARAAEATIDREALCLDHSLEDAEVAENDPQKDEQQDGANDTTAELPSTSTRNCTA